MDKVVIGLQGVIIFVTLVRTVLEPSFNNIMTAIIICCLAASLIMAQSIITRLEKRARATHD